MSHPCTLTLHHQMVRRHLASERAVPSAPNINGMTYSYQGTSSSKMPWTTNCNQRVVRQVGSTVSSLSSSSQCLHSMQPAALGFLWSIQALPQLRICCRCPPTALCGRPAYAQSRNHLPMPHLVRVRPEPSPRWSGWTGHGGKH